MSDSADDLPIVRSYEDDFIEALISRNVDRAKSVAMCCADVVAQQDEQVFADHIFAREDGYQMFHALREYDPVRLLGARAYGRNIIRYYWRESECDEFERETALTVAPIQSIANPAHTLNCESIYTIDVAFARATDSEILRVSRETFGRVAARAYYWIGFRGIEGSLPHIWTMSGIPMNAQRRANFIIGRCDAGRDCSHWTSQDGLIQPSMFYINMDWNERYWPVFGANIEQILAKVYDQTYDRKFARDRDRLCDLVPHLALTASDNTRRTIVTRLCNNPDDARKFAQQLMQYVTISRNIECVPMVERSVALLREIGIAPCRADLGEKIGKHRHRADEIIAQAELRENRQDSI